MAGLKKGKKPRSHAISEGTLAPVVLTDLAKEVAAVKRLLVLLLAKFGADSPEIAMALGVDQSTVRRLVQFSVVKKIPQLQVVEKQ